jgi:CHAT domain-containing protein/Flp pilus assembly protein TadD
MKNFEERVAHAEALFNQGLVAYKQNKYQTARDAWAACVDETQILVDEGHTELLPALATTRMNLAVCLKSLGELALARTTYETTLIDYESLIAQGRADLRPKLARTRMNLAVCLESLGELALARTTYETTLTDYQSLIDQGRADLQPNLALTRMNLALCLLQLDELALARTTYETTLTDYQSLIAQGRVELRPYLATTQMQLANCLADLGKLALARTTCEMALNNYESLIDQGRIKLRPELARTRMNLANRLTDLGELALARMTYEKSLNEYESLIEQGQVELRFYLARTHMNLGNCLKASQDFPTSEIHYQEAFKLLQSLHQIGQLFPDAIKLIRLIADWHRHPQRPPQPDKSEAFKLAKLGLDWLDELLNRLSDASTNFMLTKNLSLFRLATDLALELNQPDQAYLILERSKSRVLVEQMLRERTEPGSHVDENLRTQYRELRAKLRSLVNQLEISTPTGMAGDSSTRFFTPTTRSIERPLEQTEQLWQEQQAVEQELDKVRRAITEQDAAFGEAIQPRALTVEEVIALIPADTLVIAFEQRPEFLYLYAITAQGIQTPLQIDLSLQQVNERVEAFKTEITKNLTKKRKELTRISQWLNRHLKQSLTELTAQFEPKQIILIPHIAWHLLPIHLVSVADQPLSVRYAVRYLPSLQILRLISERPSANQGKGCIIANPWSDALEKLIGKAHELKSGEQEGYQVYALRAQQDELLAREQATSTAVRQALNAAQHSHFSCHGHFDADLTKAGLTLADCKDLAAIEMFTSIRLDNPRLVVMSACETAQIKPTLADEYMGLSSSFLFAGAHNVLATLWRVDDNASRLLIEAFYESLNEGLSPVNALQQAQHQLQNMTIEAIKARSPNATISRTYDNPYYWAGFVLIGDGK